VGEARRRRDRDPPARVALTLRIEPEPHRKLRARTDCTIQDIILERTGV
jgi:hypothetical protein